jgi:hypothetical protein
VDVRATILALVGLAGTARGDEDPLTALLSRTDKVAREVARVRGLPLKKKIPNEVVDRAELRSRLEKQAADHQTAEQTMAEGLALARWGMIPLDTDFAKVMVDVLSDQVAGYYDPETKKLTISKTAGEDADWAELVLAHELDHGLQDQAFDLQKFQDVPDSEADAAMARHALVEGDGVALMIEVMLAREGVAAPWGRAELVRKMQADMTAPGDKGDSLDSAPLVVREEMLFPYRAGLGFVAALRRHQPWTAVDAAFRRPPRSTEQVMHLEKYLADERPIAVTAAAPAELAGFTIVHTTVWGELGFQLFLRSHGIDDTVAAEAAAGWGGDRVIALARAGDKDPAHAVALARFEWDSEADAIEAEAAATRALDDLVLGAVAEHADPRTRWLALDGTSSWVERRGSALVLAVGVPSWAADAVAADAWTVLARAAAKAK